MAKLKPTQAQVQLHLQLYDLRREARLREAREWYLRHFFPQTSEEAQRMAPPGSREDAFLRMVLSYWDQACLLLVYGLLHEELFFRTTNEFFLVWERFKPFIPGARKAFRNPHLSENLEKVTARYEKWAERQAPGFLDALRGYMNLSRQAGGAER